MIAKFGFVLVVCVSVCANSVRVYLLLAMSHVLMP